MNALKFGTTSFILYIDNNEINHIQIFETIKKQKLLRIQYVKEMLPDLCLSLQKKKNL